VPVVLLSQHWPLHTLKDEWIQNDAVSISIDIAYWVEDPGD
jgi:hypothetical protein